ncbi:MAG: hypothetical protein IT373_15150 [Polyangiaceae bacterium]|nr:hypothetical protein [Polyangiaceae bacterium]
MRVRGAWLGLASGLAAVFVACGTARAGDPTEPSSPPPSAAELLLLGDAEAAAGRVREAAATDRHALRAANLAHDDGRAHEAYRRMVAAEARVGPGEPAPAHSSAPEPAAPLPPTAAPEPAAPLPPTTAPEPAAPLPPTTLPALPDAVLVVAHAPAGATLAFGDGTPEPVYARYRIEPGTLDLVLRLPGERPRRRTIALERDREHELDLARLERWPVDPPPQPVSIVRRPLTQPDETVSVEGSFYFARSPRQLLRNFWGVFGHAWDIRFGILDDLELQAAMGMMLYMPTDPLAGLRGRVLRGDLELALSVQVRPPQLASAFGLGWPGAFVALDALGHLGPHVRLDTGVGLAALWRTGRLLWSGPASADDGLGERRPQLGLLRYASAIYGADLTGDPGIPLCVTFAPIEDLALRVGTGFGMVDFRVPSSIFIPFEGGVVVTGPDRGAPSVDFESTFTLPFLFAPVVGGAGEPGWLGESRGSRRVLSAWWQILFATRVHVELGG